MLANNETGAMQPIRELCALAHERGALFHTDAVQAAGKVPVDVEELCVDLLTLSAHKLHGPKGVGALYIRKGVRIEALVHGGGQERGLRSGTENIPGIVGFGRAAEIMKDLFPEEESGTGGSTPSEARVDADGCELDTDADGVADRLDRLLLAADVRPGHRRNFLEEVFPGLPRL